MSDIRWSYKDKKQSINKYKLLKAVCYSVRAFLEERVDLTSPDHLYPVPVFVA